MSSVVAFLFGVFGLFLCGAMTRMAWKELLNPVDWSRNMALGMLSAGSFLFLIISALLTIAVNAEVNPSATQIAAEKEAACLADPACVAQRTAAKAEAGRQALIAQQKAEALRLKEERAVVKAEAAKQAECRKDLQCWGSQNLVMAVGPCAKAVQKLAKIDYEWTDGFLEQKLPKFSWVDKSAGVVRYFGDKVKFRNDFGAWTNMRYMCVYDPAKNTVREIEVRPGRL